MDKVIGINAVRELLESEKNIEKIEVYKGLGKDKIKDILEQASKRNIKVF